MPQTVREKPVQKFKIVRRVASIACRADRDLLQKNKGWDMVPGCGNLARMMAESLMERLEAAYGGDMFEHAIIPMDQEIPE